MGYKIFEIGVTPYFFCVSYIPSEHFQCSGFPVNLFFYLKIIEIYFVFHLKLITFVYVKFKQLSIMTSETYNVIKGLQKNEVQPKRNYVNTNT